MNQKRTSNRPDSAKTKAKSKAPITAKAEAKPQAKAKAKASRNWCCFIEGEGQSESQGTPTSHNPQPSAKRALGHWLV